jgi:hypothetical protein
LNLPKHPHGQEREIARLRATREIVLNVGEDRGAISAATSVTNRSGL